MESKKPIATSMPRPTFDITNGEDSSSDSGNGSEKEEEILIKPEKKPSTERKFRRISTNCVHPRVPCPTCKGKGKLSQAQSDTMLALIPVHDTRLKPKRTGLKLGIAFCLLLVVGGLCLAFLFPRKVYLALNSMTLKHHSVQKPIVVNLTMTAYLNNTNFFAVEVSKISAQILFLSTSDLTAHEVGNVQLPSVEHLGIREKRKIEFIVNTSYTGKDSDTVQNYCNWFPNSTAYQWSYFSVRISLTGSLKYWTHTEQLEYSDIGYIRCTVRHLLD